MDRRLRQPGVRTVLSNERGTVAEWGDALLSLWSGRMSHADLDVIEAEVKTLGRPVLGLVGVCLRAPIPEPELRQRLALFTYDPRYFVGSALVFRGAGMRASIIRSVMVGVRLMVPSPIPSYVTGDIHDALRWGRSLDTELDLPEGITQLFNDTLAAA